MVYLYEERKYMVNYEPWSLLSQLQRELERSIEGKNSSTETAVTADWTPPIDIKEESHRYTLWVDLPGVNPNDIEVIMEEGILLIKGVRETEANSSKEGIKRAERKSGVFYRRFSMPDTSDASGITARSSNGVLEIVIPKKAAVQPKKINVISEG